MKPLALWVLRDRRITRDEVIKSVVEGSIHAIYMNPESAERDKYSTEKVWKITVQAEDTTHG